MRPVSRSEEHVGEWKLTVIADTLPQLFAEVARVVSRACGPARGSAGEWERVSLAARDVPTLLVDWANELVGRSEVARRAYGEVRWHRLDDTGLEADVRGRPVAEWRSPLKAATYHGLSVERHDHRWKAVLLFDV